MLATTTVSLACLSLWATQLVRVTLSLACPEQLVLADEHYNPNDDHFIMLAGSQLFPCDTLFNVLSVPSSCCLRTPSLVSVLSSSTFTMTLN